MLKLMMQLSVKFMVLREDILNILYVRKHYVAAQEKSPFEDFSS